MFVTLVFRLKWANVITKLIDFFFQLQDYTADGNIRKYNSQCMNTVLQNMNSNWKLLLYKKLLKANLITSSSFVTFSAKIRKTSVNLCFKFSKVILLMYSSWLLVIYFPEIYISILTFIIEISTCGLFVSNNSLTQSIIFLPVLSKYVLTRIRNIFPIQKNKAMIRIFA